MPNKEIKFPQLGETVSEGTLVKWLKSVGESVELDEPLYEISTDKVDTEVPSLHAGVLTEIKVPEGETVDVGVVLAVMDVLETASSAEGKGARAPEKEAPEEDAPAGNESAEDMPEEKISSAKSKTSSGKTKSSSGKSSSPKLSKSKKVTSPLVRRLIRDSGVDQSLIIPSGKGDRITRKDVERALAASKIAGIGLAPSAPQPLLRNEPAKETRIPLSKIRKITAEHMRRSKETSPHVLTAVEVDFERLEKVRQELRPSFKENEGFSLTYLPFVIRAVCDAFKKYPHINASIVDDELVVPNYVNVGVAVDLDFEGLLAPVIKDADTKSLTELAREVVDVAARARSKKLQPDELSGGTFTITNPGQYGTLMQFPLINQPQAAILSTDGVKRKPVAVMTESGDESIAVHSMGVLALAWDHRVFDGAYVAAFLDHLRLIIEARNWEIEF